jgi:hypothetical protein
MYKVAVERAEKITAISNDDSLADVIKSLSRQQAEVLWARLVQCNPQLADL